MVSFTSKAGLGTYVVAAEEKSKNPPVMATANPIQFQMNRFLASCAAVSRFLPTPIKRKSKATLVPTQKDNPVKCVACTKGYAQSEPDTNIANEVFWSHCAKARIMYSSSNVPPC